MDEWTNGRMDEWTESERDKKTEHTAGIITLSSMHHGPRTLPCRAHKTADPEWLHAWTTTHKAPHAHHTKHTEKSRTAN
eukprot:121490-Rhodomonas_salina.1